MKIHVQFYAQLRDLVGMEQLDIDLPEGGTAAELMKKLYEWKPALRAHDETILIGAGVDFVKRGHRLSEGEEIAIMPPVQGG